MTKTPPTGGTTTARPSSVIETGWAGNADSNFGLGGTNNQYASYQSYSNQFCYYGTPQFINASLSTNGDFYFAMSVQGSATFSSFFMFQELAECQPSDTCRAIMFRHVNGAGVFEDVNGCGIASRQHCFKTLRADGTTYANSGGIALMGIAPYGSSSINNQYMCAYQWDTILAGYVDWPYYIMTGGAYNNYSRKGRLVDLVLTQTSTDYYSANSGLGHKLPMGSVEPVSPLYASVAIGGQWLPWISSSVPAM
jgi:hypothetical protein